MAILSDFFIKQGDTGEPIVITCQYDDGTIAAKDFTGASVEFHMKASDGTLLISSGAGTVVGSPANKMIGYQWLPGDTAAATGASTPNQCEFQVTFADGIIETFPNSRNINVHVFPQIA